ncbi:MAG TPA: hypothetical protein VLD13_13645 [Gaiellaceae bacterium]|nr:hypothetical protein [Gaiellaceae bacterium]
MQRPGVMAPPDLHEQPAQPGLMSPSAGPAEPVDPKIILWAVAIVLGAVELCLALS